MNNLRQAVLITLKAIEKINTEIQPKLEKPKNIQVFQREVKRARNLMNRNARTLKRMPFAESEQELANLMIKYLETAAKAFDLHCRRENAEAQRLWAKAARIRDEFERRLGE